MGASEGSDIGKFLSTLSLRRATRNGQNINRGHQISIHALLAESDRDIANSERKKDISIHALLAESDNRRNRKQHHQNISIHALLAESDHDTTSLMKCQAKISIHALLAESDFMIESNAPTPTVFLSTLSLRRATIIRSAISTNNFNFYPRSPCGERRSTYRHQDRQNPFLSTLSLRRATYIRDTAL